MARLRTVSPRTQGCTRRRAGKGFTYLDCDGSRLSAEEIARIRSLAIPPAWEDVWICPLPHGHIQAVGTDAAGRRQYLYHPVWRERRDREKFDRITAVASRLPAARRRVARDLERDGTPLVKATAAAVRLLDRGYFRIGSDTYTDENGSFGLTTLERSHVRKERGILVFRFIGKSSIEHTIAIDDPAAIEALEPMRRRRTTSQRLLAHERDGKWCDLTAPDVNAYLADLLGGDLTAKDFRTWHATVLAALSLAESEEPGDTVTSRRRAVRAAVAEVAEYLGNTPTIAKKSYVDPRVIDEYESGQTIGVDTRRFRSPERRQAAAEKALLELLTG